MPHELILRHFRPKAPEPCNIIRDIKIYHPGYDDEVVPLISFPGYDSIEGDIYYDFAHTACAIISNNQFDGWLSTSRDPQSPRFSGELLAPGSYWWHLPGDSAQPYAIVSDFRTWEFPRSIPEGWTSRMFERNHTETTCQVSQESHALQEAHIVPSSETEWFDEGGLDFSYGSNVSELSSTSLNAGIDNENNLILLRSDLHHAWDQRRFTFVPKRTAGGLGIAIHCWDKSMVHEYHNVPLQGFVIKELLLARLAWILLPRALNRFLVATKGTRMLWIKDDRGKLIPERKTAQQCRTIANAPLPRSTSPKKRKQNRDEQQFFVARKIKTGRACRSFDSGLGLGEEDQNDDDDDDDDDNNNLSSAVDAEELNRGRKRLRAGDTWYSYPEPALRPSLSAYSWETK